MIELLQESDFDLYQIDLTSGSFEPELVLHDVYSMTVDFYYNIYYVRYGDENYDYYLYDPATRSSTFVSDFSIDSDQPENWTPTL